VAKAALASIPRVKSLGTGAITAIRGGRVRSMTWLNAASLTELSLLDEAAGNAAGASVTQGRTPPQHAVRRFALRSSPEAPS
jgi:hypothetical protein